MFQFMAILRLCLIHILQWNTNLGFIDPLHLFKTQVLFLGLKQAL